MLVKIVPPEADVRLVHSGEEDVVVLGNGSARGSLREEVAVTRG